MVLGRFDFSGDIEDLGLSPDGAGCVGIECLIVIVSLPTMTSLTRSFMIF